MSYKVFSMDYSTKLFDYADVIMRTKKKPLTDEPGVCFPIPGLMTYMSYHPWNREALPARL